MEDEMRLQMITTFSSLITAAFGLVAALAWNDAIKEAIALVFTSSDTIWGDVIYAVIVTVLAVVFMVWIARCTKNLKDKVGGAGKKE